MASMASLMARRSIAASALRAAAATVRWMARSGSSDGPASGTTPSKYLLSIAITREARLPKPLASSEWYRADRSSHENEPS